MIIGTITVLLLAILIVVTVVIAISAPIFIHLPRFGKSPTGARLERIRQSPHYRNGQFCNLDDTELKLSSKMVLRAIRKMIFGKKKALVPHEPLPMVKRDLKNLDNTRDYYVWFGHSSYLLSLHGTTILVDPTFCAASPIPFVNKAFKGTDRYQPEDMPDRIDCLLITHDHYDHLDYETFLRLKDRVQRVVCPLGVGAHLERWGVDLDKLTELDWYDSFALKESLNLVCLPSQHFSGRAIKRNNTLWAAFLIQSPYGHIFAGGDGGYGPHFKEIGNKYPNIDLAILENGQYNVQWRNIHTMPSQLAQEVADLKAKQVITVHHSKYALARHTWDEPLKNEQKLSKESDATVIVVPLGETQELSLQ